MSLTQLLTSAPFTGPKNPDAVLADIPKSLKKLGRLVRRYVPLVNLRLLKRSQLPTTT